MAAWSKRKPASAAEQPSVHKKPRKTFALGPIPWAANSHTLAYQLLCEVEKSENFKVLFGKKDKHEVIFLLYVFAMLICWNVEYIQRDED